MEISLHRPHHPMKGSNHTYKCCDFTPLTVAVIASPYFPFHLISSIEGISDKVQKKKKRTKINSLPNLKDFFFTMESLFKRLKKIEISLAKFKFDFD